METIEKRNKNLQVRLNQFEYDLIARCSKETGLRKADFSRRAILADCGMQRSSYELLTAEKNNLAIECSVLNLRVLELTQMMNVLSRADKVSQAERETLISLFETLTDQTTKLLKGVSDLSKEPKQ